MAENRDERADAWVHGLMSAEEAKAFEEQCRNDRALQAAVDEARRRKELVKQTPRTRFVTDPMVESVSEGLKMSRRKQWAGRVFCWTLAAAGLAAVGLIGWRWRTSNLTPTPVDLRLAGQRVWSAGADASLLVQLVGADDQGKVAALVGKPVTVDLVDERLNREVRLASLVTSTLGTAAPRFQTPDWEAGVYELRVTAETEHGPERLTTLVDLRRPWKLMFSTDKPVYQPGQTIHMRSLALRRPSLKPAAGQPATFEVRDPKGNLIFKRQEASSRFGIAAADCELAGEAAEGTYQLTCRMGEIASTATVEVQRYVLPKFKVEVKLDRPFYQPGDVVQGTVQADYFFGKPVAGGGVKGQAKTVGVEVESVDLKVEPLDEQGKASFIWTVPAALVGRESLQGDAEGTLLVEVTDAAGQRQAVAKTVKVTSRPLRIRAAAEAGGLTPGVENRVYLLAEYADGRPAAGAKIETSDDEPPLTTDELGTAVLVVKPTIDRQVTEIGLKVIAVDGLTVEQTVRFPRTDAGYLLRPDQAVYDGGDTMTLAVVGSGIEPVFVDFVKDGQTLVTEIVEMAQGRGVKAFDLPPELFGVVELYAYRFGPQGLAERQRRVVFVRPARQVNVEMALEKEAYRPGDTAQLTLSLSDENGQPAPGAISLSVVDEAVFSVLNQKPGMERLFFVLEQELLEPVYAVYNWSPWMDEQEGPGAAPEEQRRRWEQGLFAGTSRSNVGVLNLGSAFGMVGQAMADVNDEKFEFGEPMAVDWSWHQTLMIESFSNKAAEVLSLQREWGRVVSIGWVLLTMAVMLGLAVALALFSLKWFIGLSMAGLCTMCLGVLSQFGGCGMDAQFANVMATLGGEAMPTPTSEPPILEGPGGDGGGSIRVRSRFPETLVWRPEIVTDDQGKATIAVELADSITRWRASGSAVTADGRLGTLQGGITVFQPFFVDFQLPPYFTRGDEVQAPITVYNYLDRQQTVELTLNLVDGFVLSGEPTRTLTLGPGEVRSTSFALRADRVGMGRLEVTGKSPEAGDAVRREVLIVSDGVKHEATFSGPLDEPVELRLSTPGEAIENSPKAVLRVFPSTFSELQQGLDALFQRPYGCFEQTSSTTYPNVLTLAYLRRTKQVNAKAEATARQYIHLGYQRLLGFEVSGGGFDWFGNPPANRTLTAYGLMEFEDMAEVHDVDPELIARTRRWLLRQQQVDGSWEVEGHQLHEAPVKGVTAELARMASTAYIAGAVFRTADLYPGEAKRTFDYLAAFDPARIDNPQVLALTALTLNRITPNCPQREPFLARLAELAQWNEGRTQCWWQLPEGARTPFLGSGAVGGVEATAQAVLALLECQRSPDVAGKALLWLGGQRSADGGWASTQATVLALKALIAGTSAPTSDASRRLTITVDGQALPEIELPADQADVVRQIDLSNHVQVGAKTVKIEQTQGPAAAYQLAFWYFSPEENASDVRPESKEPLLVELVYDREKLALKDEVHATASVTNQQAETAPMVILDLPIPPGFQVETDDLQKLVAEQRIAKFQITPRAAVVYLRGLPVQEPLVLKYRLKATMPVKLTAPAAQAYEYYNPSIRGRSQTSTLEVVDEA